MRIPPLLVGTALVLWAWRTGAWGFAVPMIVVFEGARWVPWRWNLTDKDFNRLSDVSTVGLVLLAVYMFEAHSVRGIYHVLHWLPVALAGLLAGQLYSSRDGIGYGSLFLSVRRALARGTLTQVRSVDMRVPFVTVCLVSAATAGGRDPAFAPAAAAVLTWLAWANRPQRYRMLAWALAGLAALALGAGIAEGVVEVRRFLHPIAMKFFRDRIWHYRDPYQNYTHMGTIGELKLSDAIVMRVAPDSNWNPPPLLREVVYRTYTRGVWLGATKDFAGVASDVEGERWRIAEGTPARSVRISRYLRRGKGLLAAPTGTHELDSLPVEELFRNEQGVLKVLRGPDLVEYTARYEPGRSFVAPPGAGDLSVPEYLHGVLGPISDRLGLTDPGVDAREAVARVEAYFADGFRYSLVQEKIDRDASPLANFLENTRKGHCEFYATATVLLLRSAGVPARYAAGFAVQEWSPLERTFVVRRRHAHSWAQVHVDGAWRDVDTTPSTWAAEESAEPGWWRGVYDHLSWWLLEFSRWRWTEDEEEGPPYLLWLALPLAVFIGWRLWRSERVDRAGGATRGRGAGPRRLGLDSELFELERRLGESGVERPPGATLGEWLSRLAREGRIEDAATLVEVLVPLHYRLRFDPRGIAPAERERLRAEVRHWLGRHPDLPGAPVGR